MANGTGNGNIDDGYLRVTDGKKYAVLVSAKFEDDGREFYDNITHAYSALRKRGFKKKNITVLYGQGRDEGRGNIVDREASGRSVLETFEKLADKVTEKDELFVYVSDHGNRFDGKSCLRFPEENGDIDSLYDTQFESALKNVKPKYAVMLFDQCFAGGFAEKVGERKNMVGISSCEKTEVSYGHSTFTDEFFNALKGRKEADRNGDSTVSVKEAFEYAREMDPVSLVRVKNMNFLERLGSFLNLSGISNSLLSRQHPQLSYRGKTNPDKIEVQNPIHNPIYL